MPLTRHDRDAGNDPILRQYIYHTYHTSATTAAAGRAYAASACPPHLHEIQETVGAAVWRHHRIIRVSAARKHTTTIQLGDLVRGTPMRVRTAGTEEHIMVGARVYGISVCQLKFSRKAVLIPQHHHDNQTQIPLYRPMTP